LENLTSDDIANLKKKLGLSSGLQPDNYDDEVFFEPDYNDYDECPITRNQPRPNLRVQVNAYDVSDSLVIKIKIILLKTKICLRAC
jgi:hypothetical protein